MRDQPFTAASVEALREQLPEQIQRSLKAPMWTDFHGELEKLDSIVAQTNAALAQFAASLRLADQGAGWQPISTAPKDGSRILGYVPMWNHPHSCGIAFFFWNTEDEDAPEGFWDTPDRTCAAHELNPPTHWQPLPPPPSTAEGEVKHEHEGRARSRPKASRVHQGAGT